jgi:hypothetical protein
MIEKTIFRRDAFSISIPYFELEDDTQYLDEIKPSTATMIFFIASEKMFPNTLLAIFCRILLEQTFRDHRLVENFLHWKLLIFSLPRFSAKRQFLLRARVARWQSFKPKNSDLGKFWRALKWQGQVYFMAI